MGDLLGVVQQAALEAVEASSPCMLCFGTAESDKPLRVRLEQKLLLEAGHLLCPAHVEPEAGQRLALLRMQGGQTYLVLGVLG